MPRLDRGRSGKPRRWGQDVILARVSRRLRVAIVGAGRLAGVLAPALRESGYLISEIISRNRRSSRQRARSLARKVAARAATIGGAALDADLLWICVPDREIRMAAKALAAAGKGRVRYVFHSSGALPSRELAPLLKWAASVASVHPLMTFVAGPRPSLEGVPFALEGDPGALRLAKQLVRDLGGKSFLLRGSQKAAYHAWATFTSPLWLAFLVSMEQAGRMAGLTAEQARSFAQPILGQTLQNYLRLGARNSFSGPLVRGDVETVAKHLAVLRKQGSVREVYAALARVALEHLPTRNKEGLKRLLNP